MKNETKNNHMTAFICILIANIVIIIAAFVDYKNKLREEIERSEEYKNIIFKSNSIIENNNRIFKTQEIVIDSTTKIIELQNELNTKNKKIQELQSSTLNYLTGGKNFPKLQIGISEKIILISIFNKDEVYPIRNVSVEISRSILDKSVLDNNKSKFFNIILGDLPVKIQKNVYDEQFANPYKFMTWHYKVVWQNGYYSGTFQLINSKVFHVGGTDYYPKEFNLIDAVIINGRAVNFESTKDKIKNETEELKNLLEQLKEIH